MELEVVRVQLLGARPDERTIVVDAGKNELVSIDGPLCSEVDFSPPVGVRRMMEPLVPWLWLFLGARLFYLVHLVPLISYFR